MLKMKEKQKNVSVVKPFRCFSQYKGNRCASPYDDAHGVSLPARLLDKQYLFQLELAELGSHFWFVRIKLVILHRIWEKHKVNPSH